MVVQRPFVIPCTTVTKPRLIFHFERRVKETILNSSFSPFRSIEIARINGLSKQELELRFDGINEPLDHEYILYEFEENLDRYGVANVERSVLELCAMKMSDSDRRKIVAQEDEDEELYRLLRKPTHWYRFPGRTFSADVPDNDRLAKQRWYEVTDQGALATIDAIFTVITANPHAFCQMMAL